MQDTECVEQMRAIVTAAGHYRDAMREYLVEQTELIDRGMSLDALVTSNWQRFAETQMAEERLFSLLDALEHRDGDRPLPTQRTRVR
jgi:hypothetical protein